MKKYESVALSIKEEINNGCLPDGTVLPTEEQISKKYNVSRQTVRLALAQLVEERLIVKRQGSGSTVMRGGISEKSGIIAVVATYIDDYIFPTQLREINEILSANRYTAVLAATQNRVSTERAVLQDLLSRNVDGIVIEGTKTAVPNPNFDLYEKLFKKNIPVVFFNSYYPGLKGSLSVCADNYGGGYMLVKKLLGEGHRKIAGYFKSDDIQGHERYSGFINALYESDIIIPDENVVWYTTESKKRLFSNAETTLSRIGDATAVVCYNDEIAINLIKFLLSVGKRVPEDIAVVSFDNSNLSEISPVRISSLSCDIGKVGAIAAKKLIDVLSGRKASSEIIPWSFVQKESL